MTGAVLSGREGHGEASVSRLAFHLITRKASSELISPDDLFHCIQISLLCGIERRLGGREVTDFCDDLIHVAEIEVDEGGDLRFGLHYAGI